MNVIRTQIYPSPLGDLLLGDWRGALVLCDWLLTRDGYASDSRVPHHLRHNPLSVIVPCHRVIGKNGQLTGYNGGTDALYIKERLLALEQRVAASAAPKN